MRLTDRGPDRAGAYSREVEMLAHLYRIHALTRRLAKRQLGLAFVADGEDEDGTGLPAPPLVDHAPGS
jgi:hypothetical protein